MATASNNNTPNSVEAALEKRAIRYLDEFIERKSTDSCRHVPMVSLQGHVGQSKDLRVYIGRNPKMVEDFIIARPHLWRVSMSNSSTRQKAGQMVVVEKQPDIIRSALLRILEYVQRRSENINYGGTNLNNVSVLVGQHFPVIKRELGNGLDGVKAFLLAFPSLFTALPFDPEKEKLAEVKFKNRAIVVDGVILLQAAENPESKVSTASSTEFVSTKESTSTKHQSIQESPSAKQPVSTKESSSSASTQLRLTGCGLVGRLFPAYGFIKDDLTGENAFFRIQVFQPGEENLRRLVAEKQKFNFDAFISPDYQTGKTKNKWHVVRMWCVGKPAPLEDEIGMDTYLEGDSMEEKDQAGAASTYGAEKKKQKWVLADLEAEMGNVPANIGSQPQSKSDPKSRLQHRLDRFEHAEKSNVVLGQRSALMNDFDPLTNLGNVGTSKNFTNIPPTPVVTAIRDIPTGPVVPPKAALLVVPKVLQKCDVSCQTEFNDERELLMRLFRQSPDLLKLVKAVRGDGR